jgi:hypothetical protein
MFVTIFDWAYAKWGRILPTSLRRFHSDCNITVLGVDLSIDTEPALERVHEQAILRRLSLDATGAARAARVANSRPLWLRDINNETDPD